MALISGLNFRPKSKILSSFSSSVNQSQSHSPVFEDCSEFDLAKAAMISYLEDNLAKAQTYSTNTNYYTPEDSTPITPPQSAQESQIKLFDYMPYKDASVIIDETIKREKKKRGRKRKEILENSERESDERREKIKRKRQKDRETMYNSSYLNLEDSELLKGLDGFDDEGVRKEPKKRGRPRKYFDNKPPIQQESIATQTFEAEDEEASEEENSGFKAILTQLENSNDLDKSDSEFKDQHIKNQFVPLQPYWTPIQRFFQFTQSLTFTEMYSFQHYWNRIWTEFFLPEGEFSLTLFDGRTFTLPSCIIPKFFWVWNRSGLRRLQFFPSKIREGFNSSGSVEFFCDEIELLTTYCSGNVLCSLRGTLFIQYDRFARISCFKFSIGAFDEFFKSETLFTRENFSGGLDRNIVNFLEVSTVMISLLPDQSSWSIWFASHYPTDSEAELQRFASALESLEKYGYPTNEPTLMDNEIDLFKEFDELMVLHKSSEEPIAASVESNIKSEEPADLAEAIISHEGVTTSSEEPYISSVETITNFKVLNISLEEPFINPQEAIIGLEEPPIISLGHKLTLLTPNLSLTELTQNNYAVEPTPEGFSQVDETVDPVPGAVFNPISASEDDDFFAGYAE